MKLTVNGQVRECQAVSVAALLDELRYQDAIVATAVNGDFIATDQRETTALQEGDRVEILAPMKGG